MVLHFYRNQQFHSVLFQNKNISSVIILNIFVFVANEAELFVRCSLLIFLFVARYFLLVARYFLLVACWFLLVFGYFLLVAPYFLLVARYFLLVSRCFLLVARCSLLSARCSLFFACCLLLIARRSLLFVPLSLLFCQSYVRYKLRKNTIEIVLISVLLASVKSRTERRASRIQLLWATGQLLVARVSLIYLVD